MGITCQGWEELCHTQVALRRGSQEVVFCVKIGVKIRIENVLGLAVWSNDQSGQMVRYRSMRRGGEYGVYGGHGWVDEDGFRLTTSHVTKRMSRFRPCVAKLKLADPIRAETRGCAGIVY